MSISAVAAFGIGLVTLEGLHKKASAMPLLSQLSTGVKHGTRLRAGRSRQFGGRAKIEPYPTAAARSAGADGAKAQLGAADNSCR